MTYEFNGYSALVVENIEDSLMAYCSTLKAHGFDVQGAKSVDEAMNLLKVKAFDFAWVDLGLGDPDIPTDVEGREVITEIRRIEDNTFVMVVTGYGTDADMSRDFLIDYKADDYTTKKFLSEGSWGKVFERIENGLLINIKFSSLCSFDSIKK